MGSVVHRRAALFLVVAFLFAATAYADPFQIRFSITFDPPPDSPFANGSLSGSVQFYTEPFSQPIQGNISPLGPSTFSHLDAGLSSAYWPVYEDSAGYDWPSDPEFIFGLSFNGTVAGAATTSIFPAFAFESLLNPPPDPPQKPPVVLVGNISATKPSLTASGPIFAFASPGTLVGTWQVEVTPAPVPEPASLLLLSSGLIGVRLLRRRS